MSKKKTPKNLYVRVLVNEKISIGEYIRAKWFNVVDPFRMDDDGSVLGFLQLVRHFESKEGRVCEFISYDSRGVDELTKAIKRVDPAFLTRHQK